MKLSKKCRYGIRGLIDLAAGSGTECVALGDIARRNGISPQYLEQVFASLRRAGIVKGMKGSQGGYRLSKIPEEITMSQVVEALDGNYRMEAEELPENSAGRQIAASVQELFIDRMNQNLEELLGHITLEDLTENYLERREYGQNMYYI